ncbi:MAG: M48 family peptidase, partial [Bacteroidaceae bacterium]|nr:M48 family peptidase [Bacteroidaceae bacterium]
MNKIRYIIFTVVAALLVSCGTTTRVPITGRKQRLMVSDEQVLSLSGQQYKEYMQSAKLSTNATNTAMVKRVGQKLANAVVTYLSQNGLGA